MRSSPLRSRRRLRGAGRLSLLAGLAWTSGVLVAGRALMDLDASAPADGAAGVFLVSGLRGAG